MGLGQGFVIHMAGPLGQPEVRRCKDTEDGARYQHIVEVGNHEVGVVVLEIRRRDGQHQPRESADGKQDHERHGK